jgi:hypothetical protein
MPAVPKRSSRLTTRKKYRYIDPQLPLTSSEADPLSINPDFEDTGSGHESDYNPDVHDRKSSSITPPPVIPKKRPASPRVAVISDSESDVSVKQKKRRGKKNASATEVKEIDPADHSVFYPTLSDCTLHLILELVLLIPRAELEGSQRQLLTHATTFDDALTVIYETVGCAEVKVKPVLT